MEPDKEKNSSHKSPRRPESDDPNDPEYNLSGSDTKDELNDDPTAIWCLDRASC